MKNSTLILTSILLASFLGNLTLGEENNRKPNIVFFLVDDLGWSDVGCYGSTFHETPNIDRLAKEGMRFDNAYATCHVCSPSRASILTGKYPARTNLTEWLNGRPERNFEKLHSAKKLMSLPDEEITLAETLKRHFKIQVLKEALETLGCKRRKQPGGFLTFMFMIPSAKSEKRRFFRNEYWTFFKKGSLSDFVPS